MQMLIIFVSQTMQKKPMPPPDAEILGKRQTHNKFVSSPTLSRAEHDVVADLTVKLKPPSMHGNSKSLCRKFLDYLHCKSKGFKVEELRYFCLKCIEEQQPLGTKGHMSKVASFAASTSTGTMALHLTVKHDIREVTAEKVEQIVGCL